jgi:hypothetical protein
MSAHWVVFAADEAFSSATGVMVVASGPPDAPRNVDDITFFPGFVYE